MIDVKTLVKLKQLMGDDVYIDYLENLFKYHKDPMDFLNNEENRSLVATLDRSFAWSVSKNFEVYRLLSRYLQTNNL